MTELDTKWAEAEAAKRAWMAENGLYAEAECMAHFAPDGEGA